jgi:hypothetical protein
MMLVMDILLLAAASVLETAEPIRTIGTAAECELALQVVKDVSSQDYGKPIVFDTTDPTFPPFDAETLATGWTRFEGDKKIEVASPPTEVAIRFVGGLRDSVSRCSSVRRWLTQHRIRYGRAAVKAVVARAVDDELPAGLFAVSLPIISHDGQTALVYTSDTWGGEAGGGFAHLYRRRSDGSWRPDAVRRLWIS